MSLAALTSQYAGLNGLAGYGTYSAGGGVYNDANKDTIKNNIANSFDVSAMSRSYANKENVSSANFTQQCQTIQYLLAEGRTDDAMSKYNQLYKEMKENPYYQGCTESEIKTMLQERYIAATGTSIVMDASSKGTSSFDAAYNSSLPVLGLFFEGSSKDQLVAEATGTNTSKSADVQNGLGVVAGVATGAGAVGGLSILNSAVKNKNSKILSNGAKAISDGFKSGNGILGKIKGVFSGIAKKSSGKKALIAAGIGAGLAVVTFIGNKLIRSAKENNA